MVDGLSDVCVKRHLREVGMANGYIGNLSYLNLTVGQGSPSLLPLPLTSLSAFPPHLAYCFSPHLAYFAQMSFAQMSLRANVTQPVHVL